MDNSLHEQQHLREWLHASTAYSWPKTFHAWTPLGRMHRATAVANGRAKTSLSKILRLSMKFSTQQACGKAEIDVKLRRTLLRRYTGKDEDPYPGERCLYWRDAVDKARTIRWKGPAIILAVERNPDTGTVACYWLAHGTVLLRAGAQHVRKLVNDNGMVDGPTRVQQALHNLRQRRTVRIIDLRRSNKRSIDEVDPEINEMDSTPTDTEAPPQTMSSPVQSDGHPVGSSQEAPSEQQPAATEQQHAPTAAAEPPPAAVPIAPQAQATASAMLPATALQLAPQQEEQAETRRPQLLERLEDDEDEEQSMNESSHMETPMAPPDL